MSALDAAGDAALDKKARAAGLILERSGEDAKPVPTATKRYLTELIGAIAMAPPGGKRPAFVPEFLESERVFGVALQLYQLRSARNLGIGDLADIRALLVPFADAGADFVGLNPLHALFTADPSRASPFAPSDRRYLNPLIIAADEVAGYTPSMRAAVDVPGSADMVDYPAAARAKLAVLRAVHERWQASDPAVPQAAQKAAARHRSDGGKALADFALFEALSHRMARDGHGAGWSGWPAPYQRKESREVAAFAGSAATDVAFHAWLQYVASDQLAATQAAARDAGMRIGLYLDLAVGAAPDGAHTWTDPALVMRGVTVGAPPDLFSADGQNWGLAPFSPAVLLERDFAPYRELLSAVMGPAGAVRIDHAMGLERLFLIPEEVRATEGAYVRQPGLTDALVEATHTHRAIAIGEDLGVVPPGFRDRMAARRIFSTRILRFERTGRALTAPSRYPPDALACLSTHDFPPLEAWWEGDEIAILKRLGKIDASAVADAQRDRDAEKTLLLALAGLPPRRGAGLIADDVVVALHRTAARTASRMLAVRLEDVVGGRRIVNLPGTDREHPNWRHTLPLTVDEVARSERLARVFQAVRGERG